MATNPLATNTMQRQAIDDPAPADSPGMLSQWYADYMREAPRTERVDPAQATVTNWTPGQDATVQGQIANITTSGSPLMQRAETRANQQANARGLLNSSMAVQAGQAALYDAALPIAQQDAQTFARSGEFNANAANAASINNAQFTNNARTFNASAANEALGQQRTAGVASAAQQRDIAAQERQQTNQIGAQERMQAADLASRDSMQRYQLAVQQAMNTADNATRVQLQEMDARTRESLAGIESRFKVQMQTSESMARSYQQLTDGITRIMLDPDMDATAKQAAINNLTAVYNNTLQMQSAVSGLNLGSLLTAPGAPVSGGGGGGGGSQGGAPAPDTSVYDPNNPPLDLNQGGSGG